MNACVVAKPSEAVHHRPTFGHTDTQTCLDGLVRRLGRAVFPHRAHDRREMRVENVEGDVGLCGVCGTVSHM